MRVGLGLAFALAVTCFANGQQPLVTEESIKTDLQANTCDNKARLESVRRLFLEKGAKDGDIKTEKFDNVENVTLIKKGKTEEIVIVGAHYDKGDEGCGVIDNWTGVVIIANLFAALKEMETQKTYVFVAFGKEEKGLIGSAAMAKGIAKEKRPLYCAMVNFDSFGLAYPQVLSNTSNSKMTRLAKELASEVKMPFGEASLAGLADADSSSFLQRDIPAITFHGLSNRWNEYIHSTKDQLKNINVQSVLVGFKFGGLFLTGLDGQPCSVFRK